MIVFALTLTYFAAGALALARVLCGRGILRRTTLVLAALVEGCLRVATAIVDRGDPPSPISSSVIAVRSGEGRGRARSER